MRFTELAAMTGGKLLATRDAETTFAGVSIDSRQVKPGELFIAIRGEVNDGHNYIEQAVANGAAGVLSEVSYTIPDKIRKNVAVVTVENGHRAMLELAGRYRNTIAGRFVGITGSNGKTTTKELTYRLIKAVESGTYCSAGNLNNLFGLPLALFAVPKDAAVVILEMGISTEVEMPTLADIVRPELIVITNVGPSHLEFLGTIEAVARAKLELVKKASPDVPVIVNADDALLVRETKKVRDRFITFALDAPADYTASRLEADDQGATIATIDGRDFRLPLSGRHQVYNLLAAYAILRTLGYSLDGVDTRALVLDTAPMRGQRVVTAGITIIADCYNANPDSIRAGLEAFFQTEWSGRRILVLGDMLELGKDAEQYHRQVGKQLAARQFDKVFTVGSLSKHIADQAVKEGSKARLFGHYDDADQAAEGIRDFVKPGDLVYIKGSRGIGLEAVLNVLQETEEPL